MADDEETPENDENEAATEGAEGGEGGDGEDDEEGGGFDAKKLVLFIVLPLLLLIGGGAGAYFTGMLDGVLGAKEEVVEGEEAGEGKDKKEEGKEGEEAEGAGGNFLEIPTMIVNLNTEDGTPRYLRLTVQLEMNTPEDLAAVEAVIPRVIDQFQTYLRELRVRDLRGSAGIYRLQTELLWRVNQAADPTEVKDVLFQEILIQ